MAHLINFRLDKLSETYPLSKFVIKEKNQNSLEWTGLLAYNIRYSLKFYYSPSKYWIWSLKTTTHKGINYTANAKPYFWSMISGIHGSPIN